MSFFKRAAAAVLTAGVLLGAGAGVLSATPAYAAVQAPTWSGTGYYPADGVQPLCPASAAWRYAIIGGYEFGFAVECEPDGPVWSWDAVTGPSVPSFEDMRACMDVWAFVAHPDRSAWRKVRRDGRVATYYLRRDIELVTADYRDYASVPVLAMHLYWVRVDCS